MVDYFENSSYYFIVLECIEGKDMFDYMRQRSFKISEGRAKELVREVA